jgi:hypothetical protein
VIVRRGSISFPSHTVYIQLWNKEGLQHVQVQATVMLVSAK